MRITSRMYLTYRITCGNTDANKKKLRKFKVYYFLIKIEEQVFLHSFFHVSLGPVHFFIRCNGNHGDVEIFLLEKILA